MVLAVSLVVSAVFVVTQRLRILPSLHGVARQSRGSEYYPLALFLTFVLAYDQPALYISAVLVLAVADAFAALVGVRYGSIHYEVEDSTKSLEGSLIFLVVAFLAIHLPLLLMTDLPPAGTVLAALLVATLVTMFEAVSLHGADNLFVPIGVVFCLDRITREPVSEGVYQNLSLYALAVSLLLLTRQFRWFNTGAKLVVILFTYGAWGIGSWLWAAPVLVALVASVVVGLRAGLKNIGSVKVRYVAAVALPPFLYLFAGDALSSREDWMFGPYLASLGAVVVFWVRAHSKFFRQGGQWLILAGVVVFAWACVVAVPWSLDPEHPTIAALVVLAAIGIAGFGEEVWTSAWRREPQPQRWTARRFTFSLIAGGLVLAAQEVGVRPWTPTRAPDPQALFWQRTPDAQVAE